MYLYDFAESKVGNTTEVPDIKGEIQREWSPWPSDPRLCLGVAQLAQGIPHAGPAVVSALLNLGFAETLHNSVLFCTPKLHITANRVTWLLQIVPSCSGSCKARKQLTRRGAC